MSYTFTLIEGHQAYQSEMAFLLFDLDRQFFPAPWTQVSWSNLFLDHDRLLVVVEDNKIPIGFCLFDLNLADHFAHLLKIVIEPKYRQQKLAKALLNQALLNLENNGVKNFFLEVEESNLAAQKLYLVHGFKIIHQKKDFYGTNRSALIMTRDG